MHTDDVFIGISMDKMKHLFDLPVNVTRLTGLSVYSEAKQHLERHIGRDWNSAKGIFYHIPEKSTFWGWSSYYWSSAVT